MKYHCSFGYINFLRVVLTFIFIAATLLCLALFLMVPPSGAVIFGFLFPVYIILLSKVIPLFVGSHYYSVQRNSIIISSGLLFRRVRHVPRSAIISMNIRQSLIERIFNIVSLEMSLGSGRVFMCGLSESDAKKIFKYRR